MEHREYLRIVAGSDTAVLMIHGIVGTPAHFKCLMPVIPKTCSVHNILLDGHGGGVDDFSRTSMKKWKAQVKDALGALLENHEQVIIAAHSMGTLFAIQAAVDHPDRVKALFLLSVPTRPKIGLQTALAALRVVWGNVKPDDVRANVMLNDTAIEYDRRLWKYLGWIPRYLELFAECRRIRRVLAQLKTPSLAFHARKDELVSQRAAGDLAGHPYIENVFLGDSGHFAYGPGDRKTLKKRFEELFECDSRETICETEANT